MPLTNIPSLPVDQVELWQKEKERLTALIADSQQRLHAVNMYLNASRFLAAAPPEPEPGEESEDDVDPANFMGTLAKIVNAQEEPISKKDLKAQLIAVGVPESRVKGAYFYVALNRLHEHNRITMYDDGTVGKVLEASSDA